MQVLSKGQCRRIKTTYLIGPDGICAAMQFTIMVPCPFLAVLIPRTVFLEFYYGKALQNLSNQNFGVWIDLVL